VREALDQALRAGVLVVAASGDGGRASLSFPAAYLRPGSGGLVVGASTAGGRRASFSDYGAGLSLVAPGTYDGRCDDGIVGAIPSIAVSFDTGTGCDATLIDAHGNRYAYANGTSFAAPEVAGIAALVWAARPSMTNVQVARLLEQTARRPAGVRWTPSLGWGVVDALAAAERVK
jgi:subtilisin family serine protease